MAFGFLGRIVQDVGHDVSVAAHGNNAPGGGVFGFLKDTAVQAGRAAAITGAGVTNLERIGISKVTGTPYTPVQQDVGNKVGSFIGPQSTSGYLGAGIQTAALGLGGPAFKVAEKAIAPIAEGVIGKAAAGAISQAPIGAAFNTGAAVESGKPFNFLKTAAVGAGEGAALGAAGPLAGGGVRLIANIDRKVGEAIPATKNLSAGRLGMSTEDISKPKVPEVPTLYHGSLEGADLNKAHSDLGFSLTTDKSVANHPYFGRYGKIDEFNLSPNAKIATEKDIPQKLIDEFMNPTSSSPKADYAAEKAIVDHARSKGFDAIDFRFADKTPGTLPENEIKVLNPKVVAPPTQGSTDVHIQTPNGIIRVAGDEMKALQEAKTPEDVRKVIGGSLPPQIVDKLATSIPNTKDPHIISNLISREVSPPLPRTTEGITTPVETTGVGTLGQSQAAKQITDTLAEAQNTRNLQEQGYTAERSARLGASQSAGSDLPGLAGHQAELSALKGELDKQQYEGLSGHLSPTEQDSLFTQLRDEVNKNPEIQGYAKLNTNEAIRKVVYGDAGVPTNSELGLLKNALGDKFVEPLKEDIAAHNERISAMQTFGQKAGQVAGLPRELMATADFSGGLRQGLAAATRHPLVFAKAFGKQFKYFASENAYHDAEKAIYDHPDYNLLHQSGTAILELDKKLGPTEERFISNLGEKIPVVGRLIRASNRAYTGLLNNMRANIFYDKVATLRNAGYDLNSPENAKLVKDLGKVINTSTGRGDLGRFEAAGHALSTALFAPRLIASRLSMLDPRYYINLEPVARKEALQTLLSLGAFGVGILELGELAGAKVSKDPTNADFGKIRIGDTRLDPLGGYAQYIRLGAQLAEGKKTNSTTGATTELGKGIAGSRWDVFTNFLANKEAPVPSFVTTALKGKDASGNPIDYKKEVLSRFTPLLAQDLKDLYSHPQGGGGSNAGRIGSAVAGAFGAGLQTYSSQDNPLSAKQKTYVQSLKDQGAPQDVIKASTTFFQQLKEASGTKQNVNTAIDKALQAKDLPKAQQLADTYNKELAAGMTKWAQQYGEQYGNEDLQTAYDRQKINLTPSSLQSRIQAIQSTKPY